MGAASRRIAEERFDVHSVNRVILDAIGLRAAAGHRDEADGEGE